jgi:hypothetical protein
LGQQVGCFVRSHLLQDVGRLFVGHGLEQAGLEIRLNLFQRLGYRLNVQRFEEAAAFGAVEIADDLGQVGRVQLGDLVAGYPESHRLIARQQFDVVPRDGAREQLSSKTCRQPLSNS